MLRFPHISLFRNVLAYVKHVNTDPEVPEKYRISKPVSFEGTVKLHGSNCGVVWDADTDTLTAQSRETTLTPTDDYKGFAKFVIKHESRIRDLFHVLGDDFDNDFVTKLALYGEYVGPGVVRRNKGSAVSQFEEKHWALFAFAVLCFKDEPRDVSEELEYVESGPYIGVVREAGLHKLTIDFNDPKDVEVKLSLAKELTAVVSAQCPYGKLYGLEGAGEGIVWRPVGAHENREDLFWKCKSEAHSVVFEAKLKKERPVVPADVQAAVTDFVTATVTPNRLEQGLDALEAAGDPIHVRSTGKFIKWLTADVGRECVLELADYGLEWVQVSLAITTAAREFFLAKTRP